MAYEPMDAAEYRQALAQLGYTQVGFASGLGYAPRAGQRWASGESGVPKAVAVLVRLLLLRPELAQLVNEMLEMPARQRQPANVVKAKRKGKGTSA